MLRARSRHEAAEFLEGYALYENPGSDPVAERVEAHAGAYGGEENEIAGIQAVSRDCILSDHIEKGGNRCDGAVTQFPDIHRHNPIRNLLLTKEPIKGFYDGSVHFFICLVK